MNALLDAALQYAARGWKVIPLHWIVNGKCSCGRENCGKNAGKHPRIRTGKMHCEFASSDRAQVEAWWRKWPQANVGIATGQASGLVVIDIDSLEGSKLLRELVAQHGKLPRTLQSVSGRAGGGHHLFFAWNGPSPSNSGQGLDIRGDGGLVVLPPSQHASGARYAWAEAGAMLADAPGWLIEWFEGRDGKPRVAKGNGLRLGELPAWLQGIKGPDISLPEEPAELEDIVAALVAIPNPDLGWDAWKKLMLATWAASEGSEAGRAAFDTFSRKSKKYTPEGLAEEWDKATRSPPTRTGFNALQAKARESVPGWERPSRRVEVRPVAEIVPDSPSINGDISGVLATDSNLLKVNGNHSLPAILTQTESSNPLIKLNEQYSVIGNVGGKCLVLSWVNSNVAEGLKVPCFQTFKSFSERYANRYVSIKGVAKDGSTIEEPKQLGAYWLKWPNRKSFEGIDLVPNSPKLLPGNYLNLWDGFAIQPAPGGWERMQRHIFETLAAGEKELARYIFRFAAWAVQHPGERSEVALVFRGGKGSGKGTFANAVRGLFGQHGLQIFNSKHLVGTFNGHLRNCLLLFADEAFWAGDKQGESVLKGMLTERELFIEQKGVDAVPWKNRLHVIMAANAEWAVPASHDERRYVVCDVSPDKIGDRGYFRALHDEMANGGLGAMLHAMLAANLGDWHPRNIIHNRALQGQKERSLSPLAAWWEDLLQNAALPAPMIGEARNKISASTFFYSANEGRKNINSTQLGRFLREQGGISFHKKGERGWEIPELNILRVNWERKFGPWEWREKRDSWL